jgi:hypothetical protein
MAIRPKGKNLARKIEKIIEKLQEKILNPVVFLFENTLLR